VRRRIMSELLPHGTQLRSKARVNFDRIEKRPRGAQLS
jgi:hypothetical protein